MDFHALAPDFARQNHQTFYLQWRFFFLVLNGLADQPIRRLTRNETNSFRHFSANMPKTYGLQQLKC